jgi:hypothetical protein
VNPPILLNKPEVQRATVGETQRELQAEPMEARNVQIPGPGDAALDLEIGRHGLAVFGEVLVYVEMVVHMSDESTLFKEISITARLLDQALHVCALCVSPDRSIVI